MGFKLVRFLLLFVPSVMAIAAYLLEAVFGTGVGLGSILSLYDSLNHWVAANGFDWVLPLIALFAFVPPIDGLISRDAPIGKQVTPRLIILTVVDLVTLFFSIKYLSFQPALYTVWFLLTVSTFWLMIKLRNYQDERGEFNPVELLEEVRRRELKGK